MNAASAAGRVALVTGANTGIGRVTATQLALQGTHVFLACRSEEKTRPVLADIAAQSGGRARAEFLPLDLGDLASVRQCARTFLARGLPLHLLVNNAGLAGHKGMSASGFELTFGVCHVGHFLLTDLLLDALKAAAPARIVVVSSTAHRQAKEIDFDALRRPTRSVSGLPEYAVAKLANVLFASELARRLQGAGVTSLFLAPGRRRDGSLARAALARPVADQAFHAVVAGRRGHRRSIARQRRNVPGKAGCTTTSARLCRPRAWRATPSSRSGCGRRARSGFGLDGHSPRSGSLSSGGGAVVTDHGVECVAVEQVDIGLVPPEPVPFITGQLAQPSAGSTLGALIKRQRQLSCDALRNSQSEKAATSGRPTARRAVMRW